MKIQCQSCQAKYTIADEKVLGKVVKIRCKKCSSTIVINGNEQAHADDAIGASTDVFDYANQSNDPWTVNVADGDQRTMTTQEIVAEYKTGVVNDETYCWKDGMADWLPLREVEAIVSAVKGGKMAEEVSVAPQSIPPPSTAAGAPLFGGGGGGDSPFAAHANGNGNGGALPTALFGGGGVAALEQSAPAAARRAGGRGQGGDLFGNVEKAGGEDDVMTSAAQAAMAAGAAADEKLTGQRNENSVLFSLSSLTDKKDDRGGGGGGGSNRTTATADGSGLIDIRALSANMDDSDRSRDKGARVDDIMNLSGGGAFGAALAAPILAPPPLETVDLGVTSHEQPKQSKTLIFAILGGCAFIAIAAVAVAALMRTPTPDPTKPAGTGTGSVDTTPTGTVATNDTSTPPTSTTAAAANTDTPPPPGTGAKPGTTPAGHSGTTKPSGAVVAAHDTTPAPQPAAPVAPAKPASLDDAMGSSVGKPAAPANTGGGAASSAPFDRGAAQASLGGINVASCKSNGGPTGQGHVTVTFTPDGAVQSAVVDQGPFPGTTVGGCVAGKFRGAHVPAFGGAPVRVGKSFSIM